MRPARNAVLATFFLNGFAFATWASRIPAVRRALDLGPGQLGLLLLAVSVGSVIALPSTGGIVQRFGARRVVIAAAAASRRVGLLLVGARRRRRSGRCRSPRSGCSWSGFGTGTWDVAMNVEGAEVERLLGRSIMPRFHAAFSLGTVAGAAIGALVTLRRRRHRLARRRRSRVLVAGARRAVRAAASCRVEPADERAAARRTRCAPGPSRAPS